MNECPFQIRIGDRLATASLRFANRSELQRYHRSLVPFANQSSTLIREAVEFSRLAAKRWRYYARAEEAVESFAELRRKLQLGPASESAFVLTAVCPDGNRTAPIGLAYCRRTWCHHLALDFLALHPSVLESAQGVRGVGAGMMYGLVRLANALGIPRIWGEATVNSAAFYERLLAVRPVRDLFVIEAPEMTAIIRRQENVRSGSLSA